MSLSTAHHQLTRDVIELISVINVFDIYIFHTLPFHSQIVASSVLSSTNIEPDHAGQAEKDVEDEEKGKFLEAALEYIQGDIATVLTGFDPVKQEEGDTIV